MVIIDNNGACPFFCLPQEIEKAWKMVDAAHEKETRARETIQALKQEITNLTKLVEQGAGLNMGQDNRYVFAILFSL